MTNSIDDLQDCNDGLTMRMCSSDSTWFLQMGHFDVCLRSSCAHSWHMHMCRQGSTVVSRSLTKQMTHRRSSACSAVLAAEGTPCDQSGLVSFQLDTTRWSI